MKKALFAMVALCLSSSSYAVLEVGDPVPNMCWTNANNTEVCLEDQRGKVRALIHFAGY